MATRKDGKPTTRTTRSRPQDSEWSKGFWQFFPDAEAISAFRDQWAEIVSRKHIAAAAIQDILTDASLLYDAERGIQTVLSHALLDSRNFLQRDERLRKLLKDLGEELAVVLNEGDEIQGDELDSIRRAEEARHSFEDDQVKAVGRPRFSW